MTSSFFKVLGLFIVFANILVAIRSGIVDSLDESIDRDGAARLAGVVELSEFDNFLVGKGGVVLF
jgi:hypothetical protein